MEDGTSSTYAQRQNQAEDENDKLSQANLAGGAESIDSTLYSPLPWELIQNVVSYLDNRSIKSLRLTCRLFSGLKLRINRVFISPHSVDILAFYAIADSDVYRHDIVEIVYDDAFVRCPADYNDRIYDLAVFQTRFMDPEQVWLQFEVDDNIEEINRRYGTDVKVLSERLGEARRAGYKFSMEDAMQLLIYLQSEQQHNIGTEADAKAFRCALRHFPALRKITVTPAAHGSPFHPLYETPTIRSIPLGMNYPIPRGWPTRRGNNPVMFATPWEEEKEIWRGYNMVAKILAEEKQHHHVSEFIIDAHYIHTGLNCRLFEQPCEEYSNFQTILQQPNFKKLQLSLHVNGQELPNVDWAAFRNNLLRNAIAEASQLEHFSMETNWDMDILDRRIQPPTLQTFLPIESWTALQHFRLWNFPLRSADLISTLSQLTGLRSLELGFLDLYEDDNYHDLLNDMRGTLRLHERPARPKVRLAIPIPDPCTRSRANYLRGRAIWLDEEVEEFLYRGGDNLFVSGEDNLAWTMGIVRDAFDPEYERPYVPLPRVERSHRNPLRFRRG
ncbi:uncharacterized protein TrAFT101_010915 [Trichoderma asperellum]|uniref:F-box domain-containing protein n=2 Tax=Trichoderma asperellum TaxID=101201 RepID=A0A2T3YX83_TRIA4|nr:hypothetical protein M441DRAFT_30372 [Trichoderma asperellum CBS 433.97]PTB37181.1 hypothetical protein M441DRAFT_30372 [Trichoderma asperellum CBS 433.97]UKZ96113.1 hypothetical protein TrAFT101_010915 [Trichoderma asperellum]